MDSQLHSEGQDPYKVAASGMRLLLGQVVAGEYEPVNKQDAAEIRLITGGQIGGAGWPGPHVAAGADGTHSPSIQGIHGLHCPAIPGQTVVVGFINGDPLSPVVLNTYPYNSDHNPIFEGAYFLPLTGTKHQSQDVVLGSYTGAYFAIRGLLPLPGTVAISTPTNIEVQAGAKIDITAAAQYNVEAADITIKASASLKAEAATIEIKSSAALKAEGATVEITATGAVKISAAPSVVVNNGTMPVAKLGDLTTTMLGPMPIMATGTAVLVP